jgi:glutathione S-transferase
VCSSASPDDVCVLFCVPDACVQKCYADLALYNVLTVADETVFDPETYLAAKFPNVKRHMDAVEAHPAVTAYIRSGRRRPAFVPYSF